MTIKSLQTLVSEAMQEIKTINANEALKMLMEIGQNLKNQILIIDLLNLNFRKVKFKKK